MKCLCGTELTWGGDHSDEHDTEWAFESNYHCQACGRAVMVYHPANEGAQANTEPC